MPLFISYSMGSKSMWFFLFFFMFNHSYLKKAVFILWLLSFFFFLPVSSTVKDFIFFCIFVGHSGEWWGLSSSLCRRGYRQAEAGGPQLHLCPACLWLCCPCPFHSRLEEVTVIWALGHVGGWELFRVAETSLWAQKGMCLKISVH